MYGYIGHTCMADIGHIGMADIGHTYWIHRCG